LSESKKGSLTVFCRPIGLKEAALDSPTFRATALHFSDQVDIVEKWLEGYVKTGSKLTHDVAALEQSVNVWLQNALPPSNVSEAILDHDYTILATKRYGDAAREYWQTIFRNVRKSDTIVIEPMRQFLNTELKPFREGRRTFELAQRAYDSVLARYAGQPKTKEASALREDAFQLHEARKAYIKASMDFCVQGPQIRATLDKLLVKVFADHWKEFKTARETNDALFTKWGPEMERIRGWGREMENSEWAFKRELQIARRQIEDSVEQSVRPSRELDDYAEKSAPYLGSSAPSTQRSEKQGWVYLKSVTGKPARTVWSRRWLFVKNGIFGWLVQGNRSGGVEESEKVGVLLCSTRPAAQEERRFCFEIKTKDTTIILQAETQQELSEWIEAFELAKRKALEDPASTEGQTNSGSADAAFAISPPVAPELAARGDGHLNHGSEDQSANLGGSDSVAVRSSFDVSSSRRSTIIEREKDGESNRDHASRLMQKLDLHKKSTPASSGPAGGIASLIAASHNVLPVGPTSTQSTPQQRSFTMPASTLAPSTMANPPAPTNLSKTAVVVSSERGVGMAQNGGSGTPSGVMANLWGSEKWGAVNRLERDQDRPLGRVVSQALSATAELIPGEARSTDDVGVMDGEGLPVKDFGHHTAALTSPVRAAHRNTISVAGVSGEPNIAKIAPWVPPTQEFPNYYPLPLKAQDAQFRTLFPDVPRAEKVVLVFRATWNPNEQQEFPGRVYVTEREIYFYSHHLGFVLISGVSLTTVTEVTAAPGRDCDFLFVHLKDDTRPDHLRRVTIKTFLEPLKLLQRRLNFLVRNANSDSPDPLEEIIKTLIKMEVQEPNTSGENDSWSDLGEDQENPMQVRGRESNVKRTLKIDNNLYGVPVARTGREVTKFKLPSQAVVYTPTGYDAPTAVKDFSASAKALFHVLFGDKSAVFQMLYRNRTDAGITQAPWTQLDDKRLKRTLSCPYNGRTFTDSQTIDISNDHLCYVITSIQQPTHLPWSDQMQLMTKYVITHSAKSQCRFAVFNKVVWTTSSLLVRSRRLVTLRALRDKEHDAEDLMRIVMDQVAKLGSFSKTSKAIQIFGPVGQNTTLLQVAAADLPQTATVSSLRLRTWTLFGIYRHEGLKAVLKSVSVVFDVLVSVVKSLMSLASAHSLLVLLLVVSGVYNSWHTYRDGLSWYHERKAVSFMSKLGVRSDNSVSRAIYLSDVDDLITLPTIGNFTNTATAVDSVGSTTCRTTFQDILATSSNDVDPEIIPQSAETRTAVRLSRTRASLAKQRHELLVGLRVVNRVETEIVSAEFEDWIHEEVGRCKRMRKLFEVGEAGKSQEKGSKKAKTSSAEDSDSVKAELERYCGSCEREMVALK